MALISSKGMYGLQAMYELSLRDNDKPTQVKDIAQKADIPQNYLEQLLVSLRKAELITSVRGAHGGYFLAKSPDEIFIKDILIALEGNLSVLDAQISNPVLNLFYEESNEKLQDIFMLSLAQLQSYQDRLAQQINYSI